MKEIIRKLEKALNEQAVSFFELERLYEQMWSEGNRDRGVLDSINNEVVREHGMILGMINAIHALGLCVSLDNDRQVYTVSEG